MNKDLIIDCVRIGAQAVALTATIKLIHREVKNLPPDAKEHLISGFRSDLSRLKIPKFQVVKIK